MSQTDPYIILIPNVRLSFPALFAAVAMEEGKEPQFEATFLFSNQDHGSLLDRIDTLIDRVALDEWKKKIPFKRCLRDGNERSETDGYGDGISFLCARSKTRPAVLDRMKNPVVAEDNILYAGCYVNATIRLFPWTHKTGGKGISAQLRAVMFANDGPSFGAGPIDAAREFDSIPIDAVPQANTGRSSGRSGAPSKQSTDLADF